MRIGHGYDAHRYKAGRKCILCGVEVPCEFGPDGHSDADVAAHALMDAMLGAMAMGDIGRLFPDGDQAYKDANSMALLGEVKRRIAEKGYAVSNCDITIIAQKPKLGAYIENMRKNIAAVLETDVSNVSVKATTEEKMGFTGDLTGISSHAVVLLEEVI